MRCCLLARFARERLLRMYGQGIWLSVWESLDEDGISMVPCLPVLYLFILLDTVLTKYNSGSSLNSPMYKELSSSEDEEYLSLFHNEPGTTHELPSHDDNEFTSTSTGSTSKKSVPKKRKKEDKGDDVKKPAKPRKPRLPKNASESPSKTHVNRFKAMSGEMVRTVSESPLGPGGGSSMARV
jgi:hypothetical protein